MACESSVSLQTSTTGSWQTLDQRRHDTKQKYSCNLWIALKILLAVTTQTMISPEEEERYTSYSLSFSLTKSCFQFLPQSWVLDWDLVQPLMPMLRDFIYRRGFASTNFWAGLVCSLPTALEAFSLCQLFPSPCSKLFPSFFSSSPCYFTVAMQFPPIVSSQHNVSSLSLSSLRVRVSNLCISLRISLRVSSLNVSSLSRLSLQVSRLSLQVNRLSLQVSRLSLRASRLSLGVSVNHEKVSFIDLLFLLEGRTINSPPVPSLFWGIWKSRPSQFAC